MENQLGSSDSENLSSEERERLGKLFPIVVVEYDPRWVELYEEEARFLKATFGPDVIVRTEHYGSTAVPGLAAKPVIDILVEIASFEIAERVVRPVLEPLGYGYNWYSGHMAFWKGYFPELPQKYHLHMAPGDHPLMDNLLFRDYLIEHPETAREYEKLKYRLAELHRNDREAYTDAKADFIKEITERARKERP
jgi:GrpB-like predicted nucleotidyltransferase (UPF0157 family)